MSQNSLILPTTGTVSGLQMTQDLNYALDTLNTLNSGASAPGTAEAGMLWHDTTNNLIKLRNLANSAWIVVGAVDETNGIFIPVNAFTPVPQGRLTLASNTPVMNADATAQASIYYAPYNGNALPIYNGAEFIAGIFAQLTLTLNSTNHPASEVFDIYVSLQSGTPTLSAMYWGGTSSRSTSAGGKTGTGNASITQKNGIWVNNAAISSSDSFNGSTGYAIAQYQGTYLGTFYTTAAGQTSVTLTPTPASGGTGNIIGLYNAYNRVRCCAMEREAATNWTYNSATWRPSNNSTSNRITFLDGLQQTFVSAMFDCMITAPSSGNSAIGIGLNSTTAFTGAIGDTDLSNNTSIHASLEAYPVLGLNYVQALEAVLNGSTGTFSGEVVSTGNYVYCLALAWEM